MDSGHDDPGATETAALLPFTDGIEVSINALMTVQSDYVLYFFVRDSAVSLCSLARLTVNFVRCVMCSVKFYEHKSVRVGPETLDFELYVA